MNEKMENVEGAGNVFRDLGFDNPEEELRKAEFASMIYDIIEDRELSRKDAGDALGLNQEKLSALRNGNLADFSTATLQSFIKILEHNFVVLSLPGSKRKIRWRQRGHRACLNSKIEPNPRGEICSPGFSGSSFEKAHFFQLSHIFTPRDSILFVSFPWDDDSIR